MISHLNKVSSYDIEKIDAPDVSYIENENSLKYTQIKEKCTVTLSVSSVGVSTFCAPFDIEIPENVTANYCVMISETNIDLIPYNLKDRILPAYTPAILESKDVVSKTYTGYRTSTDVICRNGILYGIVESLNPYENEIFDNKNVRILALDDNGKPKFFILAEDTEPLNPYKSFIAYDK